jgi:hypothetical protein
MLVAGFAYLFFEASARNECAALLAKPHKALRQLRHNVFASPHQAVRRVQIGPILQQVLSGFRIIRRTRLAAGQLGAARQLFKNLGTRRMVKPPWEKPDPKKHSTHHLTKKQENGAKRWAARHHVPYPSLVANMHACKKKKK